MQMATFSGRREFRGSPFVRRRAGSETQSPTARRRRRVVVPRRDARRFTATIRGDGESRGHVASPRHKGRHTPRAYVIRRRARTASAERRRARLSAPTPDRWLADSRGSGWRSPSAEPTDGHPCYVGEADTYLPRNRRQPPPPPPFP